jgi:hypothetical protein
MVMVLVLVYVLGAEVGRTEVREVIALKVSEAEEEDRRPAEVESCIAEEDISAAAHRS